MQGRAPIGESTGAPRTDRRRRRFYNIRKAFAACGRRDLLAGGKTLFDRDACVSIDPRRPPPHFHFAFRDRNGDARRSLTDVELRAGHADFGLAGCDDESAGISPPNVEKRLAALQINPPLAVRVGDRDFALRRKVGDAPVWQRDLRRFGRRRRMDIGKEPGGLRVDDRRNGDRKPDRGGQRPVNERATRRQAHQFRRRREIL